jgi:hypothetical protein
MAGKDWEDEVQAQVPKSMHKFQRTNSGRWTTEVDELDEVAEMKSLVMNRSSEQVEAVK